MRFKRQHQVSLDGGAWRVQINTGPHMRSGGRSRGLRTTLEHLLEKNMRSGEQSHFKQSKRHLQLQFNSLNIHNTLLSIWSNITVPACYLAIMSCSKPKIWVLGSDITRIQMKDQTSALATKNLNWQIGEAISDLVCWFVSWINWTKILSKHRIQ